MALTRSFKDTVKARAQRDPKFRVAMLQQATAAIRCGEIEVGTALVRDCENPTAANPEPRDAAEKLLKPSDQRS